MPQKDYNKKIQYVLTSNVCWMLCKTSERAGREVFPRRKLGRWHRGPSSSPGRVQRTAASGPPAALCSSSVLAFPPNCLWRRWEKDNMWRWVSGAWSLTDYWWKSDLVQFINEDLFLGGLVFQFKQHHFFFSFNLSLAINHEWNLQPQFKNKKKMTHCVNCK